MNIYCNLQMELRSGELKLTPRKSASGKRTLVEAPLRSHLLEPRFWIVSSITSAWASPESSDEYTPDHSTISRTRRLLDLDTHREVFTWVLGVLADRGLLQGKRIAIDATTLEANAAMRSIVRRDTGESYEEFLRGLAKASGIETPTREDLARLDRKRKKRTSNQEWK